jgi:iron complex outermembrane receptor protein
VNDTSYYWEQLSNPSAEYFVNAKQLKEPSLDTYYLPSLKVEANVGFAQITSATSYVNRHGSQIVDETNGNGSYLLGNPYISDPTETAPEYDVAAYNVFTQEFRIQSNPGRFQWIAGAFYSHTGDTEHQAGAAVPFGAVIEEELGVPLYEGQYFYLVSEHSTDTQVAGFGEASYEIIHGLRFTAGVRYADFTEHYTRNANGPLYGGNGPPSGFLTYDLHSGNTATTPKFNLAYQINADNLIYGTIEEGTRPGGVNRNAFPLPACLAAIAGLGLTQFPPSFNPDTLWNYEVGSKNQLFGGALRIEGALFLDKWKDIQREVAPAECNGSYFTGNLGSATSKGFELSVYAQPINGLSINLQASYTDATFDDTLKSSGSEVYVSAGDTLGVPPWIVSLTGRYQRDLTETMKGYFQAQVQYRSHDDGPGQNQDPLTVSYDPDIPLPDSVTLVGLRAGTVVGGADVSLFVNNLLDDHPGISRFHALVGDPLYLNRTERPRTIGITATYHY